MEPVGVSGSLKMMVTIGNCKPEKINAITPANANHPSQRGQDEMAIRTKSE